MPQHVSKSPRCFASAVEDTPLTGVHDLAPNGQLTFEWEQTGATCSSGLTSIPSGAIAIRIKSSHDAMGRTRIEQQCLSATGCTPAQTPAVPTIGFFNYSYNLLGNLVQSNNGIYGGSVPSTEVDHLNGSTAAASSVTWMTTYDQADHVAQTFVQDQPGTTIWPTSSYSTTPTLLQANSFDPFGHMTSASLSIPYPYGSSTAAITATSAYDNRARLNSLLYKGAAMGSEKTQSIGTIEISGAEQSSGGIYDKRAIGLGKEPKCIQN
jgi:hypothetical protein